MPPVADRYELRVLVAGRWMPFANIRARDNAEAYSRAMELIPAEHRDKPVGIAMAPDNSEWHSRSGAGPPPN